MSLNIMKLTSVTSFAFSNSSFNRLIFAQVAAKFASNVLTGLFLIYLFIYELGGFTVMLDAPPTDQAS